MSEILNSISIQGYKSIRDLPPFELRNINVLIGSNGAGKSNFVSFFRMLRELFEQRLQTFLAQEGGADACLYLGPQETRELKAALRFGDNGYEFTLVPTADGRLAFSSELTVYRGHLTSRQESKRSLGSGHFEAQLKDRKDESGVFTSRGVAHYVWAALSDWVVYHFHDTSQFAKVRRAGAINDNAVLRPSAENLAAFLFRLQQTHPEAYAKIRDLVRLAAPFFDDFKLRPMAANPELIQLEWQQKDSVYPMLASQLSDGTLRFICLATALVQPQRPRTILFDEPELGLHPYALTLLGSLAHQSIAPWGTPFNQVILSTQSALLLNEFNPEDIVVVDRADGQSTLRRLETAQLNEWLADYTLGELWQKNVLGGRPRLDSHGKPPNVAELSR
jgi:predicted ATPase